MIYTRTPLQGRKPVGPCFPWLLKGLLLALGMAGWSAAASAPPSCTPTAPYTQCVYFTSTVAVEAWAVPAGVSKVYAQMWGAGGGGGYGKAPGGGGGYSSGIVSTGTQSSLYLIVGGGGLASIFDYAGGGGGLSGLFSDATPGTANALVIAGAGGGAPMANLSTADTSGGGGGQTGGDGVLGVSGAGGSGGGGTASAGGAGGIGKDKNNNAPDGAAGSEGSGGGGGGGGTPVGGSGAPFGAGGLGYDANYGKGGSKGGFGGGGGGGQVGGGGGGGYFGGGGGSGTWDYYGDGTPYDNGTGGGGGSGFVAAAVISGVTTAAVGSVPANKADQQHRYGIAVGGASSGKYEEVVANGENGGDGLIVLQWMDPPTVTLTKTSVNGTGTFDFAVVGAAAANPTSPATANGETITTTAAGVAVPGSNVYIATAGTAVSISESLRPTGWANAKVDMICTDANASSDGVGSTSPLTLTGGLLPETAMVSDAAWTCAVTNTAQPPGVGVSLVTTGAFGGPFTLSVAGTGSVTTTNNLTTTAADAAVNGASSFAGVAGTQATVSITNAPAGFPTTPSSILCTDTNASSDGIGGGSPLTLSGGTIPADHMVLGSAWSCVVKVPASVYSVSISASPPEGGSASCNPATDIAYNGSASCTATPNEGYTFSAFSGAVGCTGSTCNISNIQADQAVVANFTVVATVASIPTLSEYALGLLALLMGAVACRPLQSALRGISRCNRS